MAGLARFFEGDGRGGNVQKAGVGGVEGKGGKGVGVVLGAGKGGVRGNTVHLRRIKQASHCR